MVARALGIAHQGQVDELLDRATPELLPDPLVFPPDLLLRRVRDHRMPSVPEIVEAYLDGAVAPAEGREEVHPQAGDGGEVDEAVRRGRTAVASRSSAAANVAGQELALGPVELEREGELVPPLQRILRQQRATGSEIGQRRGIGGRRLGALARDQVELGHLLALLRRRDQRGAAVELIDDLEDRLLALLRRRVRREQPADPQMRRRRARLRG